VRTTKERIKRGEALVGMKRRGSQLFVEFVSYCFFYTYILSKWSRYCEVLVMVRFEVERAHLRRQNMTVVIFFTARCVYSSAEIAKKEKGFLSGPFLYSQLSSQS
jgi:hypothetical protein